MVPMRDSEIVEVTLVFAHFPLLPCLLLTTRMPAQTRASTVTKKFRCVSGRARHSVRATRRTDSSLRRARSDAPYPAGLATRASLGT